MQCAVSAFRECLRFYYFFVAISLYVWGADDDDDVDDDDPPPPPPNRNVALRRGEIVNGIVHRDKVH